MRRSLFHRLILTLALLVPGLGAICSSAGAAAADLNGAWKLVIPGQLRDDELVILNIKEHGGKLEADVIDSQMPAPPAIGQLTVKDDTLAFPMKIGAVEAVFNGKPSRDGAIYGLLKVNDQSLAARLEKTVAAKLAAPEQKPSDIVRGFMAARNENLPKSRVRLLRAVLAQKPGDPNLGLIYNTVIRDAEAAELSADEIRKVVAEWIDGARPYGEDYVMDVRGRALRALAGSAAYAATTLDLAREAEAAVKPDTALAARAQIAAATVQAATLAGNAKLAAEAKVKSDRLEAELDQEYHKKIAATLKPLPTAGPANRTSDRVVLVELFTGAECPPCVAADVAFDGLNASYKPTQVVTLQYHLHIPGPDPLTNADTMARAEYYPELRGTPTLCFDGKMEQLPGGPLAASKERYEMYMPIIDKALARPSEAKIQLKAGRNGDSLKIQASAEAKSDSSKLRLRLALIEEQVRYVGGNNLRFHHHVVRALPGGAEGKLLADGKGSTEVTVDLAQLRKSLEGYLEGYAKEERFPKALPPIPLSNLSVVAFVQDDVDKAVLNTVIVPVSPAK